MAPTSGPPCLRVLVSASCTTRYAVSSTLLGSGRGVPSILKLDRRARRRAPARPAPRAARRRAAARTRRRPPCRCHRPRLRSPVRSTPSRRRISASACRPVPEMVSSACLAWSGARVQHVRGAVGLHDHHRDVVRDDVVQLAGDTGAFGGGGDLGLCLALLLQPGGALLQLRVVGAAGAQRVARAPRRAGTSTVMKMSPRIAAAEASRLAFGQRSVAMVGATRRRASAKREAQRMLREATVKTMTSMAKLPGPTPTCVDHLRDARAGRQQSIFSGARRRSATTRAQGQHDGDRRDLLLRALRQCPRSRARTLEMSHTDDIISSRTAQQAVHPGGVPADEIVNAVHVTQRMQAEYVQESAGRPIRRPPAYSARWRGTVRLPRPGRNRRACDTAA